MEGKQGSLAATLPLRRRVGDSRRRSSLYTAEHKTVEMQGRASLQGASWPLLRWIWMTTGIHEAPTVAAAATTCSWPYPPAATCSSTPLLLFSPFRLPLQTNRQRMGPHHVILGSRDRKFKCYLKETVAAAFPRENKILIVQRGICEQLNLYSIGYNLQYTGF